jgi:hypothetical protein
MNTPLPKLGAPVQRALASSGISSLEALARFTRKEVAELHGMGPHTLRILDETMKLTGIHYADSE